MNILMVNLMSGTDVAEVLAGTHDVDGTLDIAGTRYLDMDDTFTATNIGTGLQVGYGNPYVANLIGNYAGQAPVHIQGSPVSTSELKMRDPFPVS